MNSETLKKPAAPQEFSATSPNCYINPLTYPTLSCVNSTLSKPVIVTTFSRVEALRGQLAVPFLSLVES